MVTPASCTLSLPDFENSDWDKMAWVEPSFTVQHVNAAGKGFLKFATSSDWTVEDYSAYEKALPVINNWRASHGYPLNTFQINLRHASRRFDSAPLIAQRTKRLSSIATKLARFPNMKLSQMQDIGGCRSVLHSISAVRQLDQFYARLSQIKHRLQTRDDYISNPQRSGYRGVHLVYRYLSDKPAKAVYNGLKIEIQIRSQYQHAWATAVETVGTFVSEALKSSTGPQNWLRFFALMGSAIAMREKAPPVPDTPGDETELIDELKMLAGQLNVENRLNGYANALQTIEQQTGRAHYYLLQLEPQTSKLTVRGFQRDELPAAQAFYLDAERSLKQNPGMDAVLVSVDSLAALQRAYPNYFADTRVFVELLRQALSGTRRRVFPKQGNLF